MVNIAQTFGIGKVIAKHLTGALDPTELARLDSWLGEDESHVQLFNRIVAHESLAAALIEMEQVNTELALANVKARINTEEVATPRSVRLWQSLAAVPTMWKVAAAVTAMALCVYFFNAGRYSATETNTAQAVVNDIAPGKNGATLTLPNGEVIQLSDAKTGVVIGDDGMVYNDGTALQARDPDLREDSAEPRSAQDGQHLTASTTKGQTYEFTLPDGTRVWLNANSKITFPLQFSGKERRILMSGESYFEVAKDKRRPFIVKSGSQETEVLGTHFNISDMGPFYIRTTVLEGSVRVRNLSIAGRADEVVLKPNQEAVIHELALSVREVNASDAAAWKDGKFRFNNTNMDEVMERLGSWYDVEVRYPNGVPLEKFTGGIDRRVKLSVALDILRDLNVKFKVEGKTIFVYK